MEQIFNESNLYQRKNQNEFNESINSITQIEDIKKVFEFNPELINIGTEQQYEEYIKTIFPESKIKCIVWHGTPDGKVEEFNKDKQYVSKGFFFSNSLEHADKFATWKNGIPVILGVLLDIKNPLKETFTPSLEIKETKPQVVERAKKLYDSLILDTSDLGVKINEYIVFEPDQIHILGSNEDLEKFKQFVKEKSNS